MGNHDESCICSACAARRFNDRAEAISSENTGHSRRRRSSGPPIARNPANQAAVDQLWAEEQERRRRRGSKRFEKYRSSSNRDSSRAQTDLQFGVKGTKGGHIVVDEDGVLQFVRDDDGTIIFDRKAGIGSPPPGWE